MIYLQLRTGKKEIDDYIIQLETEHQKFSASNTKRLIRSIDGMAGKIADDLDLINNDKKQANGEEVELSSKFINSFISLAEKADKIEKFAEIAEKMYGLKSDETTITITEETTTTIEEAPRGNMFEEIEKKVKEKLNAHKK